MIARPALIARVVLCVLCIVALFAGGHLRIQSDADLLLTGDVVTRQATIHIHREFGSDSRTYLYLREDDLWAPKKLQALAELSSQLRQLSAVERVDDVFLTPIVQSLDGQLLARPLIFEVPTDQAGADIVRKSALEHPTLTRHLVSADGKSMAIGLTLREPLHDDALSEFRAALDALMAEARKEIPSMVQVGEAPIEAAIRRGIQHDLLWVVPLSLLGLLVIARRGRRSIMLANVVISLFLTLGSIGLLGIPLTFLSVLIVPVTVMCCSLFALMREHPSGLAPPDEPTVSSGIIPWLVLLIGFAAQTLSDIAALRELGITGTLSVMWSLLVARLISAAWRRTPQTGSIPRVDRVTRMLTRRVPNRALMGVLFVLVVASVAFLFSPAQFRSAHLPQAVLGDDNALVRTAHRMHQELAGIHVFYVTLDANAEGAFRIPENLQRLADIQGFMTKQGAFDHSLSLADIVAQANGEGLGRRGHEAQIPPSRQMVNQSLLLYRSRDLAPYVSHDFRRATIVVRHDARDAAALNRQIDELRTVVDHYAGPTMTTAIAGQDPLIAAAGDHLTNRMATTVAVLLAFILIAFALTFTTFKGGLAATLLSAISPVILAGLMLATGAPLSMFSLILMVVALALSTHGTHRLFVRYGHCCHDNPPEAAAHQSVRDEACPMLMISLGLSITFGMLVLSEIAPAQQLGMWAIAAIWLPCLVNLVLTPHVLTRIPIVSLYDILSLSMHREALENSPLFSGLNFYQIRKIILISNRHEFARGDCVIQQGSVGRNMFLVISGRLEVVRHDNNTDQTIAHLSPGDVFGEIGLVHDTCRTADVRALEDVVVLLIDYDKLQRNLRLFPHIMARLNFNISGILGKRLAEFVEGSNAPVAGMTGDT